MAIVTVGIDLCENVFAVHGVDATGGAALIRPSVARTDPQSWLLVIIEAPL